MFGGKATHGTERQNFRWCLLVVERCLVPNTDCKRAFFYRSTNMDFDDCWDVQTSFVWPGAEGVAERRQIV
jgi:hypothetical protein